MLSPSRIADACSHSIQGGPLTGRFPFFVFLVLSSGLLCAGQSNAQGNYSLKPTAKTVAWGYYDAKAAPVLRVKSGDTVEIQTLITNSPKRLEDAGLPADQVEQSLRDITDQVKDKGPGGHILTGPVYIEDAQPGDVLEVKILAIKLAIRSEEHTSELQSRQYLVCRLLLET